MKPKTIELNPAQTVLVLGGRGFIGCHIVEQLENFEASVLVGTRNDQPLPETDTLTLKQHTLVHPNQWIPLLKGVDVVVNAVGILRQRHQETYDQVHHLSVASLAKACAKQDIRLVHISALGLDNPVKSRFLTSKYNGEQALKQSSANWFIVRPSLVDGLGGFGTKWFRRVAKWPIHFAPTSAIGKLAPINVNDLGEAVAKIALMTKPVVNEIDRIYELGGEIKMSLFEYLDALSVSRHPSLNRIKPRIHLPNLIARTVSHFCDLLHCTPFSYGHYELLKFDNYPAINRLPELLGRLPKKIHIQNNVKPLRTLEKIWRAKQCNETTYDGH